MSCLENRKYLKQDLRLVAFTSVNSLLQGETSSLVPSSARQALPRVANPKHVQGKTKIIYP
jgi:hypothetical protein